MRAMYCVWATIIASTLAAPVAAASSFSDDFEGPTLDSWWSTTEQSGSISLTSTRPHGGNQSVQFNSINTGLEKSMLLYHTFAQPVFGSISVWMYDTGADIRSSWQNEF